MLRPMTEPQATDKPKQVNVSPAVHARVRALAALTFVSIGEMTETLLREALDARNAPTPTEDAA